MKQNLDLRENAGWKRAKGERKEGRRRSAAMACQQQEKAGTWSRARRQDDGVARDKANRGTSSMIALISEEPDTGGSESGNQNMSMRASMGLKGIYIFVHACPGRLEGL